MAYHAEQRQLAKMEQGRAREGTSKEEDHTLRSSVMQIHQSREGILVVVADFVHLMLGL